MGPRKPKDPSLHPPRAAAWLYRLCLGPGAPELGDLIEEFNLDVVPRDGAARARRWFWWQVLRSLLPSLWTPLARHGWGPPLTGFALGAAVFYGAGGVVVAAINTVSPRLPMSEGPTTFLVLFGTYLVASAAVAYGVGRLVSGRAGAAAPAVAWLLCVLIWMPELLTFFGGSSGEGPWMRLLWGTTVPACLVWAALKPPGRVRTS